MSSKKPLISDRLPSALVCAGMTIFVCLLGLIPAAVLIRNGALQEQYARAAVGVLAAFSAFLVQRLSAKKGETGGVLSVILRIVMLYFLLILMAAGIEKSRFSFSGALLPCASAGLGFVAGALPKINKKHKMRSSHKRKYNR